MMLEFEYEGDEKSLNAVLMPIADRFFNVAASSSGSRAGVFADTKKTGFPFRAQRWKE
jgi:hypothetical protein